MDISLVILAAGIGSRYGGGVKQLAPVGPNGELIIDYSIHDAVKAGFNKVVFIIRHDIYADFREVIGERMERRFRQLGVKWEYAFQELVNPPAGRTKPWGTGQAVLACKGLIHEPFAVINADDYYGAAAFEKAREFLCGGAAADRYGMVGYVLKNTLSENGGVTRGICHLDADGKLVGIDETRHIVKTPEGAATKEGRKIPVDSLASMNFWMFPPEFMGVLEEGFPRFCASLQDPCKDEYLLPIIVDEQLQKGACSVQVIPTDDRWFGITYKEDLKSVVETFVQLHANGVYPDDLFSDLAE